MPARSKLLAVILMSVSGCHAIPAGTDTVPCISLKPICRQPGDTVSPETRAALVDYNIALSKACGIPVEDLCP